MSAENVEFVQQSLELLMTTGEIDAHALDEAVEVYDHDLLDPEGYTGYEGVQRWLEDWGEAWGNWAIEPEEFIDAGARVVVVLRMRARGRGSGIELDREDAIVCELRAGKIARMDYFNNKRQALEAAGASRRSVALSTPGLSPWINPQADDRRQPPADHGGYDNHRLPHQCSVRPDRVAAGSPA